MNQIEALQRLRTLATPAVESRDVAALLQVSASNATTILRRLAAEGMITHLTRGRWMVNQKIDRLALPELISAPYPAYISLQSALFHHGLIEQIPSILYAVTPGRPRRLRTPVVTISFHRMPPGTLQGFRVARAGRARRHGGPLPAGCSRRASRRCSWCGVRTVFSDTTSSRAMSGPSRSLSRRRSTSSSRSLSGSIRGCSAGGSSLRRCATAARSRRTYAGAFGCFAASFSSAAIGRPLVDERRGRSPPARPAPARVPARRAHPPDRRPRVTGERLQDEDLDDAARSAHRPPPRPAGAPGAPIASRRCVGTVARSLGQEQPRERDVLELAHVAELVGSRETALARPVGRLRQPSPGDPHPCLQGSDRAHIRGEVADVEALGLGEQLERPVQVALGLPDRGQGDARPIAVLGQAVLLAQLLGLAAAARLAPSRSSRSRRMVLIPTCMSAAPRSTWPPCPVASASPRSKMRSASPRRPCASRMSARASAHPMTSER